MKCQGKGGEVIGSDVNTGYIACVSRRITKRFPRDFCSFPCAIRSSILNEPAECCLDSYIKQREIINLCIFAVTFTFSKKNESCVFRGINIFF